MIVIFSNQTLPVEKIINNYQFCRHKKQPIPYNLYNALRTSGENE